MPPLMLARENRARSRVRSGIPTPRRRIQTENARPSISGREPRGGSDHDHSVCRNFGRAEWDRHSQKTVAI